MNNELSNTKKELKAYRSLLKGFLHNKKYFLSLRYLTKIVLY